MTGFTPNLNRILQFLPIRPKLVGSAAALLFLLLLSLAPSVLAQPISGEISYNWVSGETYRIRLILYRSCSSPAAFPSSYDVRLSSPCGTAFTATLPLQGVVGVSNACAASAANTTCTNPASPMEGVTQHTYQLNVTLPAKCLWLIQFQACNRTAATYVTGSGSSCFYIEAQLNNSGTIQNTSPVFTFPPIHFTQQGKLFTFNPTTYDQDGDSLTFEAIEPLTVTSPGLWTTTSLSYPFPYGAYNPFPAAPLNFTYSLVDGQTSMTPTTTGSTILAIRVREYRNGVLIGSIVREMRLTVEALNGVNTAPPGPIVITRPVGAAPLDTVGRTFYVCRNSTLQFQLSVTDATPGDMVSISSLVGLALPGSITSNTNGNPATMNVTWTPTSFASLGSNPFSFLIFDFECPRNNHTSVGYNVEVLPDWGQQKPRFTGPTEICNNTTLTYTYTGVPTGIANTFWDFPGATVLSGSGIGPYTVRWTTPGIRSVRLRIQQRNCISPDSIITLTVYKPNLTVTGQTPASCTTVNDGTISVSGSGSAAPYQFSLNGGAFQGTNTFTFTGVPAGNQKVLIRDVKGCLDSLTVNVALKPQIDFSKSNDTTICPGGTALLRAFALTNPFSTVNYQWAIVSGPNLGTLATQSVSPATTTTYRITVTDGCNQPRVKTITVTVSSPLVVQPLPTPTICASKPYLLSGQASGGTGVLQYNWFELPANTLISSSQTFSVSPATTTSYRLDVADACTTISRTITVNVTPATLNFTGINITPSLPVCEGTVVTITVGASGGTGVYSFSWSTGQTGATITRSVTGFETLNVSLSDTCQTLSGDVDLSVYDPPLIALASNDTVVCAGGTVQLSGIGIGGNTGIPYAYQWSLLGGGVISTTQVTTIPAPATPGASYIFRLTDGCNTVRRDTVVVTTSPAINLAPLSINRICTGDNLLVIPNISNPSGQPLTYSWETTGGVVLATTPTWTATPSTTTTYVLKVSSPCTTVTRNFTIPVVPNNLAVSIGLSTSPLVCFGTIVALTANATGGSGNYVYNWSNGVSGANNNVSVTSPLNLTVTVVDSCNNATAGVTLTPFPQLVVTTSPDTTVCAGGTVNLRGLATGGRPIPSYTYQWQLTNGTIIGTTPNLSTVVPVGPSTTYQLVVTDSCSFRISSVVVTVSPTPNVPNISHPRICQGSLANLDGTTTNLGGQPVTYSWQSTGGTVFATTPTWSVSPPVTTPYVLVVSTPCTTITRNFTIVVVPGTLNVASITSNRPLTVCVGNTVNITATATGGTGNYTYNWNTGATGPTVSSVVINGPTKLVVTVTDSCQIRRDSIQFNVFPSLTITRSPDTTVCAGGTVNLRVRAVGGRGVPDYSYQWQRVGGPILGTTRDVSTIVPVGTTFRYAVRVIDSCGTTRFDTVTVLVNPSIIVPTISSQTICFGNNANFNGTATNTGGLPITYSWQTTTGTVLATTPTWTISPATSTNYNLVVSSPCTTVTRNFAVIVVPNTFTLLPILSNRPTTVCVGTTVNLTARPGLGRGIYTYSWSNGATTANTSVVINGPLKVVVTVSDSCQTLRDSIQFNTFPTLALTTSPDTSVCENGIINLRAIATGGRPVPDYVYQWSLVGGGVIGTTASVNPIGTAGALRRFAIRVTDSCGSAVNDTVNVSVVPTPTVPVITDKTICSGNSIILNGTASATGGIPIDYTWEFPVGTIVANGPTFQTSPLDTTTYLLKVTTQCTTITRTVTVNVIKPTLNPGTYTLSLQPPYCPGSTFTITANATGGRGVYTYTWSNGFVGPSQTITINDTLTLSYTVSDSCLSQVSANIFLPTVPDLRIGFLNVGLVCRGNPVTLTAGVAGGRQPYTNRQWYIPPGRTLFGPPNTNTLTITPQFSGRYYFEATDSCGTYEIDSINVNVVVLPIPNAGPPTMNVCEGSCITLQGSVVAAGISQVQWSPPNGLSQTNIVNPQACPVISTWYYLRATYLGCPSSVVDSVFVRVNTRPTASAPRPDLGFCTGGGGVQIAGVGTGGTGPLTYRWIPSTGLTSSTSPNPIANPAASTLYRLVVTDSLGCVSDTAFQRVNVWPIPLADAGRDTSRCLGDNGIVLNGRGVAGGFGSYSYSWTPGTGLNDSTSGTPLARPLVTTTYRLSVINNLTGCPSDNFFDPLSEVTVTVVQPPTPNASPTAGLRFIEICEGESVQLGRAPTGGVPTRYEWFPRTGLNDSTIQRPTATPAFSQTYFLRTWLNNCPSNADSIRVLVKPRPTLKVEPFLSVCAGGSIAIPLTVSGATGPFTYSWSPPFGLDDPNAMQPIATPSGTTQYQVTVAAQGCDALYFDSVTVFVVPQPIVDADSTTAANEVFICQGQAQRLPAQIVAAGNYGIQWSPSTGLDYPTRRSPLANPSVQTRYKIRISLGSCYAEDSVVVTPISKATASVTADKSAICLNRDFAVLDASGSVGASTVLWSPAGSLSSSIDPVVFASPTVTTRYKVVIGRGNCIDSAFYTLNVLPQPTAQFGFINNGGCGPADVSFVNQSTDAVYYQWNFGDGGTSNEVNPKYRYPVPGSYSPFLVASGNGGCRDTFFAPALNAGLGLQGLNPTWEVLPQAPDTLYMPYAVLNAKDTTPNIVSRLWRFGDGFTSTDSVVRHQYELAGQYQVQLLLTDRDGCTYETATSTYTILKPILDVPNVFTPNGDGIADEWSVLNTNNRPIKVGVFDRVGRLWYRVQNQPILWNGQDANGIPAPEGVYFYVIETDGRMLKGNFTLIR
jgi:gliding motility-associated-like protein